MPDRKRIGVIFGGQSTEHDISRISAQYIIKNLNREKFDVIMFGITKDGKWLLYDGPAEKLESEEWQEIAESQLKEKELKQIADSDLNVENSMDILNSDIDVVFPVLHGCMGEDGTIQGYFEIAGIPYVGSGVLGSALCMDKAYSKIVFEKEGLPQGKYVVFSRKQINENTEFLAEKVEKILEYPCFVKPSNAGSSVGVTKAHDRKELIAALKYASKFDIRVLAEEFINGREIECAILGNDEPVASIVGEILPSNEFYDFEAKYINEKSATVIPADLSKDTIQKIRDYAVRAYKAADCAGLSRVDFFVHKKTGEIYLNEINTMPGFTSISMYPKLWEASGIPCEELLERLIKLALERHEDNKRALNI
ncbi:MAG: D-alanine--D-alanine ligase family protein [Clostridia bacterium]|jgi:D-alanine-D-alanine ligase